ncbi:HAD family hydrolase [Clostridium sp. Marseille-P2415]|uniref:HAD family hydrolase n=1 Tax=Clostridium sp. Marseille-P2415 TaxID=1805471 RepID=UPI0013566AF5|nr:HAD family hydrolase [Clostridium sp. Marseille-P2415]
MVKALFFDLFFTLINPEYSADNEYDILNITQSEWEKYAEEDSLYEERALGIIKTEQAIIENLTAKTPFSLTEVQKQEILIRRENRMKNAMRKIDEEILETLNKIKNKGIYMGLISNADIIDCKYWKDSPLSKFFDLAVFSCNVGMMKPDIKIYQYAMEKMNVMPADSMFVGDGGSNELNGAKLAGMRTVFTEFLEKKPQEKRTLLLRDADYRIDRFSQLTECIKKEQSGFFKQG